MAIGLLKKTALALRRLIREDQFADRRPERPAAPVVLTGRNRQFVTVTGAAESGRYPGLWHQYDAAAGVWNQQPAPVWVVAPPGETLSTGTYYDAAQHAPVAGRPVFVATSAGGPRPYTYKKEVYHCIADRGKVYEVEVSVTYVDGVRTETAGDESYLRTEGCCGCDSPSLCCDPPDDVYLHVLITTPAEGAAEGYDSDCYDCLTLPLQYNAAAQEWSRSTCVEAATCCDEIDHWPYRVYMTVEDVYYGTPGTPPGHCAEWTALVDQAVSMYFTQIGEGYGNSNHVYSLSGNYDVFPAEGSWTHIVTFSACSNQNYVEGEGYVEQALVNVYCQGSSGAASTAGGHTTDFGCSGVLAESLTFTLPVGLGSNPCQDCNGVSVIATFSAFPPGSTREEPCPCVTYYWGCDAATGVYELTVEVEESGGTTSTTYQPAGSPDPCTAREWFYHGVELPDGSVATVIVNGESTIDCGESGGGGSADWWCLSFEGGMTLCFQGTEEEIGSQGAVGYTGPYTHAVCTAVCTGGGGGIETACCPGVELPETLQALFTSGDCLCLNSRVVDLEYAGLVAGLHVWRRLTYLPEGSCSFLDITLRCAASNSWTLTVECQEQGTLTVEQESGSSCDPLSLLFSFESANYDVPSCCGNDGSPFDFLVEVIEPA